MSQTPASDVRALYQLQLLDLDVDATVEELAAIEARIGETEELSATRRDLDDSRRLLQDLESTRLDLDLEARQVGEKLVSEERRLYQGQVRNPKELESLRREVESLRRQRREIEDRELDVMARIEPLEEAVEKASADLERITAEWEAEQRALAELQSVAEARLAGLRQKRRAKAAAHPAGILALYEDLRRGKRGRAVASVERSTCMGCRVVVPQVLAQRARSGRDLVYCPSCGRILYFGS